MNVCFESIKLNVILSQEESENSLAVNQNRMFRVASTLQIMLFLEFRFMPCRHLVWIRRRQISLIGSVSTLPAAINFCLLM